DGTQTRSFIYVTDEVEGLLKFLVSKRGKGEVINIGSNHEIKIIELAKLILKLTGSSSKITFKPLPRDDPKRRCPDIAKARKILKWKPTTSLGVGLEKTIAHFRLAQK
ncbi:MAG: GDP-mannose 4,6-dehydratase, partial [Candidatus Hadarchaeales archaeon]